MVLVVIVEIGGADARSRGSLVAADGSSRTLQPADIALTPLSTWTSPAATSCGTCHGVPPSAPHAQNADCAMCHTGYTSTYHGYFATLRLGHTLLTRVPIGSF